MTSSGGIPINTDSSPTVVLELIYRLKIKDVMTSELHLAGPSDTMRSIQKIMKENSITGVPVVDNGRLIGIISVDDIINALDLGYIDDRAQDHMSRNIIVLEDDMPLSFGITYFDKYKYGRFPVLNKDNKLVGIVTSRDISSALLVELNKEMEQLEQRIRAQNPPLPVSHMHREYIVRKFDFENAGKASTEIKKILKNKELDRKTIRRIAVAAYELEMNQVKHSDGGRIIFLFEEDRVEITAVDTGPGIPDINLALQEGYSTANDWIRSLGFGAGMGLPNVRRVSDEFNIASDLQNGTTAKSIIFLTIQQEEE
ncbi:CBS domain-containing protein [Spirochaeta cellobiosiphila]|uniref:CBS domain-containing protein n=1 Tax=Spirochaeta cellobiosiphila TaxID=504483 RepID=UPI0004036FF2|nr:CBS domain-containing protein [Spirochaeta cellobiosiphila]